MEVARRVLGQQAGEAPLLNRPELVAVYLQPIVAGLPIEKFYVFCLNRKNRLIKRVEINSGIATAALAHPLEVFRAAIQESAAAILCVNNLCDASHRSCYGFASRLPASREQKADILTGAHVRRSELIETHFSPQSWWQCQTAALSKWDSRNHSAMHCASSVAGSREFKNRRVSCH